MSDDEEGNQLDLFEGDNDSPLCGSAKNERDLMAFNFFSLTREHQTSLPPYDDGKVRIEVKGTDDGIATIWDKELLIYLDLADAGAREPGRKAGPDIPGSPATTSSALPAPSRPAAPMTGWRRR